MKRCPQCEFIYENDQGRCDMDGSELISAPTSSLKLLTNITPPLPSQPTKPQRWRRLTLLPLGVVILCAMLGTAYYFLTQRAVPRQTEPSVVSASAQPSASVTAEPQAPPALMPSEASPPPAAPTPAPAQESKVKTVRRAAPVMRATTAPAPATTHKQEERRHEPAVVKPKKESGLVSLLKKTGRVLKKPFKL